MSRLPPAAGWLRAVVFDFDGTICDTESAVYEAWRSVWADHGVDLPLEEWVACVGTGWDAFSPVEELARRCGRPVDDAAVRAEKRAREAAALPSTAARPGVREWLEDAVTAGLALGVASSSDRDWVVSHLARLGLDGYLAEVRAYDDVGVHKPDPASYVAVCEALGVAPTAALAVEDSPHGVAAAKAAGLLVVACPGPVTAALDFSAADIVVSSLSDHRLLDVARTIAPRTSR